MVTLLFASLLCGIAHSNGDLPWWVTGPIAHQVVNNQSYQGRKHPKLRVEHVFLYRPTKEWTYSHHPHMTYFKHKYIAMWSNGRADEDAPEQRVLISTSADFKVWSTPRPLVDSQVSRTGRPQVCTAAGFHQYNGTLVAYFSQSSRHHLVTHLKAVVSTDGEHWGPIRDLGLPIMANHGPQKTRTGRLILTGNFMFPYTDDPYGLSGWKIAGFHMPHYAYMEDSEATFEAISRMLGLPIPLCEGAFYQTDDGQLHMLLRSTGSAWKGTLWITHSSDNGESWSRPTSTEFTDNDTKFHFGRLPNKWFYYVGCPDKKNRSLRTPLVLSLSRDGITFDHHYVIADDHFSMARFGQHKHGDFGYPHSCVHNGYLNIIISRQKEAIEVIRFRLSQLKL